MPPCCGGAPDSAMISVLRTVTTDVEVPSRHRSEGHHVAFTEPVDVRHEFDPCEFHRIDIDLSQWKMHVCPKVPVRPDHVWSLIFSRC